MSAYITRYCERHGEWDMDTDHPDECPECFPDGALVEIERLRAEVARLTAELAADARLRESLTATVNTAADERDAALARAEAAEKDAGRYRWLRDARRDCCEISDMVECDRGETLDAAIDAAMEGGKS